MDLLTTTTMQPTHEKEEDLTIDKKHFLAEPHFHLHSIATPFKQTTHSLSNLANP